MERNSSPASPTTRTRRRITLTGLPDAPGTAAAIFEPARRSEHQCRHDRAELAERGRESELTFTVPAASLAQASTCSKKRKAAIGFDDHRPPTPRHEAQRRRRRHAHQSRRRREDVRDPGRAQDQHPRHHHQRDQGLGADPRRTIPSSPSACSTPPTGSTRRMQRTRSRHGAGSASLACGLTTQQPSATTGSPADEARHRLPRLRGRGAGRRDELDLGAPSRLRSVQCRRVRRDRLRSDDARSARHRDRRDEEAHRQAVRRQPDHHAPDALRADRRLRAA